jgi:hypothetical protein
MKKDRATSGSAFSPLSAYKNPKAGWGANLIFSYKLFAKPGLIVSAILTALDLGSCSGG